jgi:HD-GYP domain-containing protein (c-di-GMP phosphodiesterase class II)
VVVDRGLLRADRVRTAEVVAALALATDLAIGVPLEHGLHSTLIAVRLATSLGVDQETARQTYYGCLLFYVGCTATAGISSDVFSSEDSLTTYATPVRFGSRIQMVSGMMKAIASPEHPLVLRAAQIARGLPKLAREFKGVVAANCEVAQLLSDRLGLPPSLAPIFGYLGERWDGQGGPLRVRGEDLPLPMRIVHVARDAAFQHMLGGQEYAVEVVKERGGAAFDPLIVRRLVQEAPEILSLDTETSVWDETLSSEPYPQLIVEGVAIDRALAAMGDFADLASPYLTGHSAGVAALAAEAAEQGGYGAETSMAVRRAGAVHDVGRVAVPLRIWHKTTNLNQDDWERIRLHAYHTERVLDRSTFLAAISPLATAHHERLDGSGYHRGVPAPALSKAARLLAAADACHAMTEPRPHRPALLPDQITDALRLEVGSGRLDADAVAAVLTASGHRAPRLDRPAGLTEREAQVIGLLARGHQTKQIGQSLGISAKTADRHVQNAYQKIGVSTRAAATLFAMHHGLVAWGELPISRPVERS